MAGRLSDQDSHIVLNNRFGAVTATTTATHWLGLSTTTPTSDGAGVTEPVGNGYARVQVPNNTTNWPNAAGRQKSNGAAFTFPTATPAGWGTITHFVLFDSQTGTAATNVRAYGPLNAATVVAAGETRSFPIGSIVITAPGT